MNNLEVRGADPHTVKKKEKEKTHTAVSVSKTKGMMSDSPKVKKLKQVG